MEENYITMNTVVKSYNKDITQSLQDWETYRAIRFAGLNATGIVISDAASGIPFSFPPNINLL